MFFSRVFKSKQQLSRLLTSGSPFRFTPTDFFHSLTTSQTDLAKNKLANFQAKNDYLQLTKVGRYAFGINFYSTKTKPLANPSGAAINKDLRSNPSSNPIYLYHLIDSEETYKKILEKGLYCHAELGRPIPLDPKAAEKAKDIFFMH